jgi:hypothetical protein
MLGSQWVVLFWKVMETLGGGACLEKVSPWEPLKVRLDPQPVPFLCCQAAMM